MRSHEIDQIESRMLRYRARANRYERFIKASEPYLMSLWQQREAAGEKDEKLSRLITILLGMTWWAERTGPANG